MKKKILTIVVDVSRLTDRQIMDLTLEMSVQTEDYPVGKIEVKEKEEDV